MGWKTDDERRAYIRKYTKRPYVKEKTKLRMRKWREENAALVESRKPERNAKLREKYNRDLVAARETSRRWAKNNPEKASAMRKKYHAARKAELIEAYGGACQCCGEDRYAFLTVDHVVPVRSQKRYHLHPSKSNGYTLFKWLKANGWPKDSHRLMCWNCNLGRKTGPCPHEVERSRASMKIVFE